MRWNTENLKGKAIAVFYRHGYYGCDSGCCGSEIVAVTGPDEFDEEVVDFDFYHDKEVAEELAETAAKELGVEVDRARCQDPGDCW